MAANKKNNINVDRPIVQSSGYNGSEPVRICPNCNKPKPISEFGFRKWEMVKLETSPGAKTVDKAG